MHTEHVQVLHQLEKHSEQTQRFTNVQPKTTPSYLLHCQFIQLLAGHEGRLHEHRPFFNLWGIWTLYVRHSIANFFFFGSTMKATLARCHFFCNHFFSPHFHKKKILKINTVHVHNMGKCFKWLGVTVPSGSSSLSIASWSLATVKAWSSLSTGLSLTTWSQLKAFGLKHA